MPPLSKFKIFISVFLTVVAIICALPNFVPVTSAWLPSRKVSLGLDLKGGAHLLLDVDFEAYLDDLIGNLTDNLRKNFKDQKIGYKHLLTKKNSVQFELRSLENISAVKKIINKVAGDVNIKVSNGQIKLSFSESRLAKLLDQVIEQSIEVIRMRVDSTGVREPIIHRQGDRHILLQVPGEEHPENLKNILGKTAKLAFHLVDEACDVAEALKGHLPAGSLLVKGEDDQKAEYYLVIKKKSVITGDYLTDARTTFDQNSRPVIAFAFNHLGGALFAEVTKNHTGQRLAIILDNKLLCSPVINEPILGGSGSISGNYTVASANELALLLKSGALPAPLKIIEERNIGPNLGADSIDSGKKAGMIGFAAVAIFMVWSYGLLGVFANLALTLALLYILALLSVLQATLTLPGIAGIILTIGMAVDANVLIYERIREEIARGASNLYAIRQGFDAAFATIVDSNITTLIVAFLLYICGVGAIKGFAVTLTVGIISSMFTAVVVTKLLVDLWVKYFQPKSLGL